MGVRYGAYISRVGGGCSAPPIGDSSIGRTPATIAPQMLYVRRAVPSAPGQRLERLLYYYSLYPQRHQLFDIYGGFYVRKTFESFEPLVVRRV